MTASQATLSPTHLIPVLPSPTGRLGSTSSCTSCSHGSSVAWTRSTRRWPRPSSSPSATTTKSGGYTLAHRRTLVVYKRKRGFIFHMEVGKATGSGLCAISLGTGASSASSSRASCRTSRGRCSIATPFILGPVCKAAQLLGLGIR